MKSVSRKATWREKRRKLWECRIREFRHLKDMSLRDVSKETGISSANICQIEHGMDLNLSTAMTLAQFFDAQISDLWKPLGTQQ